MRYFKGINDKTACWRVFHDGTVQFLSRRGLFNALEWGHAANSLEDLEEDKSTVECYEDGRLLGQYRYFCPVRQCFVDDPIIWRVGSIVEYKVANGWVQILSPDSAKDFIDCCPRHNYVECDINGNHIVEVVTQQVTAPREEPVNPPNCRLVTARNMAMILMGAVLVIDNDELIDTAETLLRLLDEELGGEQ
jgi:hypothetical protein